LFDQHREVVDCGPNSVRSERSRPRVGRFLTGRHGLRVCTRSRSRSGPTTTWSGTTSADATPAPRGRSRRSTPTTTPRIGTSPRRTRHSESAGNPPTRTRRCW
jgi:hypothetical protein